MMSFTQRSLILIILFMSVCYMTRFSISDQKEVPTRHPLDSFPGKIGTWTQAKRLVLDDAIAGVLGADDYIEAIYTSPYKQNIDLYVSYFNVLKEGKQFHSPKNCLIGGGSTLLKSDVIRVPIEGGLNSVPVGCMVIQNGNSKQVVIYWYQRRGKIFYSEYEERISRVLDAIFKKRSNGAFVRIIAMVDGKDIRDTRCELVDFASLIIPILKYYISETN
jgi:EpsI family protein